MSDDTPDAPAGRTVHLKPAAPKVKVASADPAPAQAPAPRIVGVNVDAPDGETVKKADFIDRVVARAGVKKKDAKPAIEAALTELAAIMAAGGELVLPPMGKLKTVKIKDLGDGAQMMTLKLRTMKDGAGQGAGGDGNANSGVAVDDDDG